MYKEVIIGWFKHFDFLLLDAGLLEVSLIIAYWLRHGFGGVPPLYQNAMWAILVIHICAVFFLSSYKGIIRRGYLVELKKVIEHCTQVLVKMVVRYAFSYFFNYDCRIVFKHRIMSNYTLFL